MYWLIELFFGEWECVVAKQVTDRLFIVCHKHTVTSRIKGYGDWGNGQFTTLEKDVVQMHIDEEPIIN